MKANYKLNWLGSNMNLLGLWVAGHTLTANAEGMEMGQYLVQVWRSGRDTIRGRSKNHRF